MSVAALNRGGGVCGRRRNGGIMAGVACRQRTCEAIGALVTSHRSRPQASGIERTRSGPCLNATLEKQAETLSIARNLLLPRLMNGEISR